jgi:hypothetical protein
VKNKVDQVEIDTILYPTVVKEDLRMGEKISRRFADFILKK